MGMTDEEIKKIVEDALPEMREAVVKVAKEELANVLRWKLSNSAAELIATFFTTEIKPELEATLRASKAEILKHLLAAVVTLADDLEERMISVGKEKIGKLSSHDMEEIFKRVF